MNKTVYLVNPCEKDILENAGDRIPIGLISIASNLEHKGYRTDVIDLNHYSSSYLERKMQEERPLAVGISAYVSPVVNEAIKLSKLVPKGIKKIAGGFHASVMPESLTPYFDSVVVGEGEESILEAITKDGIIRGEFPDLSKLDDLDYGFVNMDNYGIDDNGKRMGTIITSRGCPFNCIEENEKLWFSRIPNNKIKKAKIGDKVMAINEFNELAETTILTIRTQDKELFEIETENGKKLKLTEDHPVFTKRGWILVKNLTNNDEVLTLDFKEKISFNKKVKNPMKNKEVIKKMINTTKERGWNIIAEKRLIKLHKEGKINHYSEKAIKTRHKSKNIREQNGNFNENSKFRNYYDLKNKIKKEEILYCSICKSNKNLLVHHKDFNHNNDNIDNLIVVCKSCHEKIHNKIINIKKMRK